MATHTIKNDRDTTWNVDTSYDTWVVAKSGRIVADNYGIRVGPEFENTEIRVLGEVKAIGFGGKAIYCWGESPTIHVGRTGILDASKANAGIHADGVNAEIVNDGLIVSKVNGIIATQEYSRVENNGTIRADTGFWSQGEENALDNYGVIKASRLGMVIQNDDQLIENHAGARIVSDELGIYINGSHDTLFINDGLLKGKVAAVKDDFGDFNVENNGRMIGDVDLGLGVDTIVNRGRIEGDVLLGGDNDVFAFRGGRITGVVDGGEGDDIYRVFKAGVKIEETVNNGDDTVESRISHKLGANIEDLELAGSKDIKGTGNGLGNLLVGNGGDNGLSGKAGDDILNGYGGRDMLTGGDGAYKFVFATGHGRDVVTDFQNGFDKVAINSWAGIDSYTDLMENHVTVDGADIVIAYGADSLRLKNVALSELDMTDFLI